MRSIKQIDLNQCIMQGMLSRSITYLFDKIDSLTSQFTLTVSCFEIYSEHVYDLLVDERDRISLPVREHQTDGFFLEGIFLLLY